MEINVREREGKALAENQALRDKIDTLTKENYNLRQDKETAAGVVGTLRAYLDHAKEKNAELEREAEAARRSRL